jgi:hypothetical protein
MANNNYGFTSVNQQVTSGGDDQSKLAEIIAGLGNNIISVRVVDIILDDTHPKFQQYGAWSGIGTILYEEVRHGPPVGTGEPFARPLFPNFKNYPVVNEIVVAFFLPNQNINDGIESKNYYYLPPISIWNAPNLNAIPDTLTSGVKTVQSSQRKSYEAIEEGQVIKSTNEQVEYNYNSPLIGGSFEPKSNIRPLLSFAGDVIIEGRFGNSIRFGSTTKSRITFDPNELNTTAGTNVNKEFFSRNDWSSQGNNGDPILILRNGNINTTEPGYVPMIEDINQDPSSIYLTSTQTIPLITNFNSYPSITNEPRSISSYSSSQAIISSERVILNASKDNIIIDSNQNISLSSINDIGLYSRNGFVNLTANRVNIGNINASEGVIFGDKFITDFKYLLKDMKILVNNLSLEPKLIRTQGAADNVNIQIDSILDKINEYTSNTIKIS